MNLVQLTQTSETKYATVFLNIARDGFGIPTGMREGYRPGDKLRRSFRIPLTDREKDMRSETLAEKIFHLLNVGDDPDFGEPDARAVAYRLAHYRSLSVGDVLEINGTYLAVARMGFEPIDEPDDRALSLPF